MTTAVETPKTSRRSETDHAKKSRASARRLLTMKVEFIPNRAFCSETADEEIMAGPEQSPEATRALPADMPAHLARMCETELLSAEQERTLFRRMNYLKYKVNLLRDGLDEDDPDLLTLDRIENLVREAKAVRDQIVQANIRLVISVVKKFVTPQNSFDEMLSDGIMTLMNAVDKFDYDRGFRFSTYAYRSIARSTYRLINARQKDQMRFNTASDLLMAEDTEESEAIDEKSWVSLNGSLVRMMRRLDRREQFIIRGRYALGAHRKTRTFQFLADKLGVSKERARQLEQRAVGKLRAMAAELKLEEMFLA